MVEGHTGARLETGRDPVSSGYALSSFTGLPDVEAGPYSPCGPETCGLPVGDNGFRGPFRSGGTRSQTSRHLTQLLRKGPGDPSASRLLRHLLESFTVHPRYRLRGRVGSTRDGRSRGDPRLEDGSYHRRLGLKAGPRQRHVAGSTGPTAGVGVVVTETRRLRGRVDGPSLLCPGHKKKSSPAIRRPCPRRVGRAPRRSRVSSVSSPQSFHSCPSYDPPVTRGRLRPSSAHPRRLGTFNRTTRDTTRVPSVLPRSHRGVSPGSRQMEEG